MHPKIVLFDGECNLCNSFVKFIIIRDKKSKFMFASLKSNFAQAYFIEKRLPTSNFKSSFYLKDSRLLSNSDAILHILVDLGGAFSLLYMFLIIPKACRDVIYSFISNSRNNFLKNKNESCIIPTRDLMSRFIE